MLFLCSNIGSLTSSNNIGNVLTQEGEIESKKGKTTIKNFREELYYRFRF